MMARRPWRRRKVPPDVCVMREHGPISGVLRVAVAAVFGFMALFHGPVMTFAKAASVAHETVTVDHASHQHHQHHSIMPDGQQPLEPAALPACNAFGCFVLVESLPVRLPAEVLTPLGALSPGIAQPMLAADIEPPIPPPRPQV